MPVSSLVRLLAGCCCCRCCVEMTPDLLSAARESEESGVKAKVLSHKQQQRQSDETAVASLGNESLTQACKQCCSLSREKTAPHHHRRHHHQVRRPFGRTISLTETTHTYWTTRVSSRCDTRDVHAHTHAGTTHRRLESVNVCTEAAENISLSLSASLPQRDGRACLLSLSRIRDLVYS